MKIEEQIALEFLKQYSNNIKPEPDGNITPDFLLDGRIAVEVRRFNQYHIKANGKWEGLEAVEYSLLDKIKIILDSFSSMEHQFSVHVSVDFKRPVELKSFKEEACNKVETYVREHFGEKKTIQIGNNISIYMTPLSKKYEKPFVCCGVMDLDNGGFVIENIFNPLPFIISEKEGKLAKQYDKYPVWWLLLVDTMGVDWLDLNEIETLKSARTYVTWFDKVILIPPVKGAKTHGVELQTEKRDGKPFKKSK